MLNFIICDDNDNILNKLAQMLESIFIKNNFDAQILLKTSSPEEVLNYHREISARPADVRRIPRGQLFRTDRRYSR